MTEIITIDRHIIDTGRRYTHATGRFTGLLQHIALAAKVVSATVRRAGLVDVLGSTGRSNIQGEDVQKLDRLAHDTLLKMMVESGYLAVMASEEDDDIIVVPNDDRRGSYVVNFDPLDGSSNIDANASIGTIFSVLPRRTPVHNEPNETDCLQPGRAQLAAGYVVYGSSTMFIYTTGAGVHGFTLDPTYGEFILSHPNIRTPEYGVYYSANTGNTEFWPEGVKQFISGLHTRDEKRQTPFTARYIGSLVPDFHRNLIYGGIFLYPPDTKKDPRRPKPKLRLLYEANPLAFVCEQAGGRASDGFQNILDIIPSELHQRVPLYIGSKRNVDELEEYIRRYGRPDGEQG